MTGWMLTAYLVHEYRYGSAIIDQFLGFAHFFSIYQLFLGYTWVHVYQFIMFCDVGLHQNPLESSRTWGDRRIGMSCFFFSKCLALKGKMLINLPTKSRGCAFVSSVESRECDWWNVDQIWPNMQRIWLSIWLSLAVLEKSPTWNIGYLSVRMQKDRMRALLWRKLARSVGIYIIFTLNPLRWTAHRISSS